MTLIGQRCNPYGYGTDRGPRHLMGGIFGPDRAGPDLLVSDGIHGIGVCERMADGWYIMVCPVGHSGPRMPLCGPGQVQDARGDWYQHPGHVAIIQGRMAATCTKCVMPPASRELWEDQERATAALRRAYEARDAAAIGRIKAQIEDIGKAQVELTLRGHTPRRRMQLIEVS